MHGSPMNIQSPSSPTQSRVFGHKRQRSATFANVAKQQDEDHSTSATESCCTTSDESSGDESDDDHSIEHIEEEERLVAAKRRRRADLDGLKKSVRLMEAQVVDASAQLRDLAAVVAHVVARRQLQQLHGSALGHRDQHTHHLFALP